MGSEQNPKKIVIVGGGLVGGICACVLAKKQNYNVEIYESRADLRSENEKIKKGRSINMAVSARGRAALKRAGLEELVLSKGIQMRGRMIHSTNGTTKPILYDPINHQCIYSVSRRFLNEILISEAEKLPNVEINFSHKLIDSNLEKGQISFQLTEGNGIERKHVKGDLIIGADGAHSTLRQSILNKPMTNFRQMYIDHGYMELEFPSTESGKHSMAKNYLHIWPRNEFMLIALPNLDGSFTGTLFMPIAKFEELDNEDAVATFFTQEFPDAMELIGKERLVQQFLTSKPSNLISVKCNPFNYGKGLLIGDAAHAMVPFFGQGMNAGFEDVLLLDDALPDELNLDALEISQILSKFSERRVPDAHAICELALYNYIEMRCLVNQPSFIIRRFVDYKLYSILGNAWQPLYNNVTFSLTPYATCITQKERQDHIITTARNIAIILSGVGIIGTGVACKSLIQKGSNHIAQLLGNAVSRLLTTN